MLLSYFGTQWKKRTKYLSPFPTKLYLKERRDITKKLISCKQNDPALAGPLDLVNLHQQEQTALPKNEVNNNDRKICVVREQIVRCSHHRFLYSI